MTPGPEDLTAPASTGDADVDAAVESAVSDMAALDAFTDVWLEADQIRYLRVIVEEGIAELARADEAQFEYLAECAMLAGENLQDARLHVIEQRLEPEGGSLAGFLTNLGLMLAVELAVVAGAGYALPGILAFAAMRAQSRSARRLVTERVTEKQLASETLAAIAKVVDTKTRQRRREVQFWHERQTNRLGMERSMRELSQARNEYAAALQALETSEALAKKAQEAAAAVPKTVAEMRLKSPGLQEFLSGMLEQTVVARVAENSASEISGMLTGESATTDTAPRAFQTSTLVGQFLAESWRDRADAAARWARLRRHVRMLTDTQFLRSTVAHELFLRIHNEPCVEANREFAEVDRKSVILGIEGALWLTWLRQMDALGTKQATGVPIIGGIEGGVLGSLFITGVTTVEGDDVSEHFGTQKTQRLADGIVYSGIGKVSDGQAEYLYDQFAHGFFTRDPGQAPTLLKFDAARYSADNPHRLDRIAEMKLLVIVFFQLFADDPAEIGGPGGTTAREILRQLLEPEPDDDPFGVLLQSLPPQSDPEVPEEGFSDPSAAASGEAEGSSSERAARDAATKLATMVTDLDLKITQYPDETFDDSAAGAAAKADADELLRAIEQQQDAVQGQFDLALALGLGLAGGQQALLDEIRAHEARIARLRDWPPPAWKWYGPPAPEPSPNSPSARPNS